MSESAYLKSQVKHSIFMSCHESIYSFFFLVNFEHVYMQNKRYHSCALFSQQITINNVAHEIIIEQNTIHLKFIYIKRKTKYYKQKYFKLKREKNS